ncbi:MAG: hypothetical protein IT452_09695 [Planctomycetia bacterium]|nr:hypothetical protein [Planctomycetia bacterium]
MKRVTAVLVGGLLLAGCVHRHVTVAESAPPPDEVVLVEPEGDVIIVEEVDPVWDGHTWVYVDAHVHGPGCGHWFHHGCWHLRPFDWTYVEIGYAHFGITDGFIYGGNPWARVWDGCRFLMLEHHVHGHGCGHFYHHGCWNTHAHDYVYIGHRRHHFSHSPPKGHHSEPMKAASKKPKVLRSTTAPTRAEGGSTTVREPMSASRGGSGGSRVERVEAPPARVREPQGGGASRPEPRGAAESPQRVTPQPRGRTPQAPRATAPRTPSPAPRVETPVRRTGTPRPGVEAPARRPETPSARVESAPRREPSPKQETPRRKASTSKEKPEKRR